MTELQKIKKIFNDGNPTLAEVELAAKLAAKGDLTSIVYMNLENIDLSRIKPDHLSALASCVTDNICFYNVTPACQLTPILMNAKCEYLSLKDTTIDRSQTRLLLKALNQNVKHLTLYSGVLNLYKWDQLILYNGRGKCESIYVDCSSSDSPKQMWRNFAKKAQWQIVWEDDSAIRIEQEQTFC